MKISIFSISYLKPVISGWNHSKEFLQLSPDEADKEIGIPIDKAFYYKKQLMFFKKIVKLNM